MTARIERRDFPFLGDEHGIEQFLVLVYFFFFPFPYQKLRISLNIGVGNGIRIIFSLFPYQKLRITLNIGVGNGISERSPAHLSSGREKIRLQCLRDTSDNRR
ncbi:hypothetical protein CEXT_520101 [Caerostris extrusa]|uniref:Uncharacterized protein n=1 Tax=Caerostris extrusa TaxID=172846 RepID=A0AAV4N4K3_CAEEX|nr:hypothetical protein CEXT_520101 [Caerostris extrusa]